jgi:hypothetical protein
LSGRTVLNKYSLFVSDLHKAIKNRDAAKSDSIMRKKASIIASFSSSHSWKTYEYVSGGAQLDKDAVINEKLNAFAHGWMEINEDDIEEFMSLNITEYSFCMWLFYTMDKEQRKEYSELFRQIKKEFVYGLEPIERVID